MDLLLGTSVEGAQAAVKSFYERTSRPDAFRWEQEVRQRLTDPATGRIREDLLESKSCEICSGGESVLLFEKDGFPHYRCRRCESIYVNPALRQEVVRELFYGEGPDPWLAVLQSEEQKKFDRVKFRNGLQVVEQRCQPPGKLLDVGCSFGLFLEIARDAGWQVMGIEPHRQARDFARAAGFPVLSEPLARSTFPEASFDAVTLWEILDHVAHPRDLLSAATRILKPGGVLLVAVRNSNSLAARLLRERCVVFLGRAHYTLFSVEGLRAFLEEFGLNVYFYETYIAELGVIRNYLQYEDPYGMDNQPVLLDVLTPEYILRNDLGYKILMAAQKA
jgi:SAM-dependent methyltransferase